MGTIILTTSGVQRRLSDDCPRNVRATPSLLRHFSGFADAKGPKNGAYRDALFSPKAKVRGSNPLGSANKIKHLDAFGWSSNWR
jgi:hypothetical protein